MPLADHNMACSKTERCNPVKICTGKSTVRLTRTSRPLPPKCGPAPAIRARIGDGTVAMSLLDATDPAEVTRDAPHQSPMAGRASLPMGHDKGDGSQAGGGLSLGSSLPAPAGRGPRARSAAGRHRAPLEPIAIATRRAGWRPRHHHSGGAATGGARARRVIGRSRMAKPITGSSARKLYWTVSLSSVPVLTVMPWMARDGQGVQETRAERALSGGMGGGGLKTVDPRMGETGGVRAPASPACWPPLWGLHRECPMRRALRPRLRMTKRRGAG